MLEFFSELLVKYENTLAIIGIISAVIFVVSLLITPWLLGKISVDYFVCGKKPKSNIFMLTFANIVGVILVFAGVIMLITPGQGVISILLGLFLMDFPGKRKLELKLIQHNSTFKTLNWIRNKINKPPLKR